MHSKLSRGTHCPGLPASPLSEGRRPEAGTFARGLRACAEGLGHRSGLFRLQAVQRQYSGVAGKRTTSVFIPNADPLAAAQCYKEIMH